VTPDPRTYKQLAAVWGIYPILAEGVEFTYANLSGLGKSAILERSLGKQGDVIVVTSGYPVHESGSTNTLRLDKL
jgi:pyruvate kinase